MPTQNTDADESKNGSNMVGIGDRAENRETSKHSENATDILCVQTLANKQISSRLQSFPHSVAVVPTGSGRDAKRIL
jgi:hypothetical protein